MSTSTTPKQSALDLIDSRPLTRNQKNLVALAVVGNISEFFDIFLIGFVVSVLTKPWNLTGTEAGVILACSGLGTVVGSIMWGRLADKIGRRSSLLLVRAPVRRVHCSICVHPRSWLDYARHFAYWRRDRSRRT